MSRRRKRRHAAALQTKIEWMNNSPFSMGWLMAMFDLPVMTDKERKQATRLRPPHTKTRR
jgi:hypothetical protein